MSAVFVPTLGSNRAIGNFKNAQNLLAIIGINHTGIVSLVMSPIRPLQLENRLSGCGVPPNENPRLPGLLRVRFGVGSNYLGIKGGSSGDSN